MRLTSNETLPPSKSRASVSRHCPPSSPRKPGSGKVVDRAGRCVGIENGGRAAANDFDPLDGLVQPESLVAVQITERRVMLNGHSVFEQGDGAEAIHRDAAGADVTAGLTAGGFHPEAGHGLQ